MPGDGNSGELVSACPIRRYDCIGGDGWSWEGDILCTWRSPLRLKRIGTFLKVGWVVWWDWEGVRI
ncbi:MAG: hypothetical protein IIA61_07380 [Candidatus Marinimicrobia bacterium]|nr:hypothetical protein [Candidatus Neomarinimicrobiota bacterium]